ncbi:hypothetical protein BBJ28_00003400 [Nothophytophthora sp. Chile5]|nr:hypothetical protein BBJ28_00003400 [Nothophytophthora sp. Chile5]
METVGCGAQNNTSMGLRYTITASMKTKFPLNRDFKTTKELVVYSRAVDHVPRPLEVSTSQEKHSPFGAIGFCHLSAAINRSSQAVGGLVSVRWTVSNQSSEAVDSVSVSLRRVVTFKAGNQLPVNGSGSHNARSHHFRGVREHKTLEDATELTLARQNPALPLYPSAKTNSMTSEYFVVVTCHFTLHKNVAVELPIEVFASSTEDSGAKTEGENGADLDVGAVIFAVGTLVGQLADGS